jgi:Flp pilus assembly protein TadG
MRIINRKRQPRRSVWGFPSRLGAATVELALCVPFLLTIAFGMIECCNLLYLRTRMFSAAYESVRLATRPATASATAATGSQVTSYCTTLLQQLGVQGAQVTLTPSNLSTVVPLQVVTVSITAPLSQNTLTSLVLSGSQNLSAQASLAVE